MIDADIRVSIDSCAGVVMAEDDAEERDVRGRKEEAQKAKREHDPSSNTAFQQ